MRTSTKKQLQELLTQGKQNALIYLNRRRLEQTLNILDENNLFICLKELQDRLALPKLPRRIECYDISHLSGKFVYGSMVTFIDGRPNKKYYKLFKTKNQVNDDFANHAEILTRRIQKFFDYQALLGQNNEIALKKNLNLEQIDGHNSVGFSWNLPDLIIVDGGKGQLSHDYAVLEQFSLARQVPICSIAKRIEEIFLPDQSDPILFDGQTKFLLQRIRDEAHRFAITANREARLKTASQSELDEIAGIGPKTKLKLLQVFGSVKKIIEAIDQNPALVDEVAGPKITEKLKGRYGFPASNNS